MHRKSLKNPKNKFDLINKVGKVSGYKNIQKSVAFLYTSHGQSEIKEKFHL